MKTIKLLLIATLVITAQMESSAQTIGIKAGLNMSHMDISDGDQSYDEWMKKLSGFHLGVTASFPISEQFSFETGLVMSQKGFLLESSEAEGGYSVNFKHQMSINYLEIPITVKMSKDLGSAVLYGNLGPYLSLGMSGEIRDEYIERLDGKVIDEEIDEYDLDFDDDGINRMDMGLTMGIGVEFNSFLVGVSYDLGLLNVIDDSDVQGFNRTISVSLGYILSSK